MPKINRFQIINFRYSKGGMRLLTDKIMFLNGDSTQFEATNSVGKSMQIQTLLQSICPLADVSKKAIDIYKIKQPVYSLIEWILNDGETILLTGIGFERKSTATDEETSSNKKNDLFKYFTFTVEYNNNSNLTLDNIGIIEYDDNGNKKINSLSFVESRVRALAKGSNGKINVFAQSSNARYSEKLAEYGISQKEFKDIIVKLNSGEYTLNAFINQYDTTEKLLRQRIFPLIEENLVSNSDIPRIKEQKSNVVEFMKTVIDNRDALDSYNELSELLNMVENIESWLGKTTISEIEKIEAVNKLSDLYYLCEQKHLELKDLLTNEQTALEESINNQIDIRFKESSYKYRLDEDIIKTIESKLATIQSKIADTRLVLESNITDLNTLKLNEIEQDIKECTIEKSKLAAEKEVLTTEHQELIKTMDEVGSNVKYHLVENIKTLESNIKKSNHAIWELNDVIEFETDNINKYNNKVSNINAKIESFKAHKERFHRRFDSLCSQNNILEKYIVRQLDKVDIKFDSLLSDLDKEIVSTETEINNITKEIENLNASIKDSREQKTKIETEIRVLASSKDELNKKLKEYNAYKTNIDILVNDYELDETNLWDADLKINTIDSLMDKLNHSKEDMLISKHNLNDELNRLKKGGLIHISEELLNELKNLGIVPIMGSEYLIQKNNKEELLEANPLMPYSIIVTQNEYNKLINTKLKTFSESLIPVIIRENINLDTSTKIFSITDGMISSRDSNFLNSIDLSILDPELKKEKTLKIENQIQNINKNIEECNFNIKKLNKIRADISRIHFSQKDNTTLEEEMNELDNQINSNKEDMILKESLVNSCKLKISEFESNSKILNDNLFNNKKLQSQLAALSEDFIEIEKNNELEIDYRNETVELLKKIDLAKDEVRGYNGILDVEKDKRYNTQKELDSTNNILNKYNVYNASNSLNITLDEAIARYETLSKDSTGINIADLDKKLSSLENRYKKLCISKEECLLEAKDLIHREPVTISATKNELRNNIEKLEKEISSLSKEASVLDKDKSQREGALSNQSKNIVNEFGKAPCMREDIENINFKDMLKDIKIEIEESRRKIKNYDRQIVKIETMLKDLEKNKQERRAFKIDTSLDVEYLKGILDAEISNKFKELAYNSNKYNNCILEADDFNSRLDFKYDNILKVLKVNKDNYSKQTDSIINVKTFIVEQMKIYAYNREFVSKLKETIVMDLVNYCKDVMEQLRVFNRLGTMNGEKFFEFKLPNEEAIRYNEVLEDVIDDIMLNGDEKDVLYKIDTYYMINRLISISSLKIKVMLFELNGRRDKIEWNNVLSNTSGGQRFCISFVVLTLLLEYKRYDSKKISNMSASKVLIMDNPFGETSEEEFLVHVFGLADKFDVQIVSYTHITNYSVRERFKKIYKMTVEQTTGGREVVLIENEKIQEDEYVNQFKYHIAAEQQQFMGFEEIV